MEYSKIPMDMLDLESDHWDDFRFTAPDRIKISRTMISDFGQLAPPLVWEAGPAGTLRILTGFSMIKILRELERTTLVAGIYKREALNRGKAIRLVMSVHRMGQALSELDKVLMIRKLHDRFSLSLHDIASLLAEFFDFPRSLSRVEDYLQISMLPEPVRKSLQDGSLHATEALLLSKIMPAEDREEIFDLIHRVCKPGRNLLREILELLLELSVLKEDSPLGIFKEALASTEEGRRHADDSKKKGAHLVRDLRKSRYPVMVRESELFHRRLSELSLPGNVRITRATGPEDTSLRIHFTAHDEENLHHILGTLGNLADSGRFENLFDYQEDDEDHA